MTDSAQRWFVYLIRNRLNQLYTGITVDPKRRFLQHAQGKGAKALIGKGPLELVFCHALADRRSAAQTEYWIKQQSRQTKLAIIAGTQPLPVDSEDYLSSLLRALSASN